jgi:hypothetical protein
MLVAKMLLVCLYKIDIYYYYYNYVSIMSTIIASSSDHSNLLTEKMGKCKEDNCEIILASPAPCDLPLPPKHWLAKDPSMVLLDAATEAALDYYWAGQVKACQYAIFHIC